VKREVVSGSKGRPAFLELLAGGRHCQAMRQNCQLSPSSGAEKGYFLLLGNQRSEIRKENVP